MSDSTDEQKMVRAAMEFDHYARKMDSKTIFLANPNTGAIVMWSESEAGVMESLVNVGKQAQQAGGTIVDEHGEKAMTVREISVISKVSREDVEL